MKKNKVLRVVKVAPGRNPEVVEIENKLEAMQKLVGGYIEPLQIEHGVCIVCNEEGKLEGLELNRALRTEEGEIWEIIAGTFFIVGDDYENGEFISLTDEQTRFYREKFHFPEMFYMMGGNICSTKIPEGWRPGMTGDDI